MPERFAYRFYAGARKNLPAGRQTVVSYTLDRAQIREVSAGKNVLTVFGSAAAICCIKPLNRCALSGIVEGERRQSSRFINGAIGERIFYGKTSVDLRPRIATKIKA